MENQTIEGMPEEEEEEIFEIDERYGKPESNHADITFLNIDQVGLENEYKQLSHGM